MNIHSNYTFTSKMSTIQRTLIFSIIFQLKKLTFPRFLYFPDHVENVLEVSVHSAEYGSPVLRQEPPQRENAYSLCILQPGNSDNSESFGCVATNVMYAEVAYRAPETGLCRRNENVYSLATFD